MEWNVSSNKGESVAVVVQAVAMIAVYALTELDAARIQALEMRLWHTVTRAAWAASSRCALIGLRAERRYHVTKG